MNRPPEGGHVARNDLRRQASELRELALAEIRSLLSQPAKNLKDHKERAAILRSLSATWAEAIAMARPLRHGSRGRAPRSGASPRPGPAPPLARWTEPAAPLPATPKPPPAPSS